MPLAFTVRRRRLSSTSAITVGAFAMRLREEQVVLVYGAVMLVLWARLIALGLGYNVMNYFVFKANLRKAREIYRDTGLFGNESVLQFVRRSVMMGYVPNWLLGAACR